MATKAYKKPSETTRARYFSEGDGSPSSMGDSDIPMPGKNTYTGQERHNPAGAGRGFKNPLTVKSDGVKEMLQEVQDEKDRKKISDMGYAKGGSVRGSGLEIRGKTKGRFV